MSIEWARAERLSGGVQIERRRPVERRDGGIRLRREDPRVMEVGVAIRLRACRQAFVSARIAHSREFGWRSTGSPLPALVARGTSATTSVASKTTEQHLIQRT